MNLTNNDIIQLQHNIAIDRNTHSYRELFNHFYAPLIKFSLPIVKSKEAAEEVYSDVMLNIWNLGNGLNNIINLKAYLFRSIKNASLSYISKYNTTTYIDIDSIDLDFIQLNTGMDDILYAEFNKQVYLSVKSLPPKC